MNNAGPARAAINPNIPDEEDEGPQDGQDDAGDPPTIEDACQIFDLPSSCVNFNQAVTVIVKRAENHYITLGPIDDPKLQLTFITGMTGIDVQRITKITSGEEGMNQ